MRSVSDERLFHTAKFLDTALRNEKNQRKRVMSGVEGALSTRTPRPRWPPPQGGRTSPPPQGGHRPPP